MCPLIGDSQGGRGTRLVSSCVVCFYTSNPMNLGVILGFSREAEPIRDTYNIHEGRPERVQPRGVQSRGSDGCGVSGRPSRTRGCGDQRQLGAPLPCGPSLFLKAFNCSDKAHRGMKGNLLYATAGMPRASRPKPCWQRTWNRV